MGIELGEDIRDMFEEPDYSSIINIIHSPTNVKSGSNSINNIIQNMMKKYFGC